MNRKRRSATMLFLTEMILVILFFSMAAVCVLQIYMRAAALTNESDRMRAVLNASENVIAALRAGEGDFSVLDKEMNAIMKDEVHDENMRVLWYDKGNNLCLQDEGAWQLQVQIENAGEGLRKVDLTAREGNRETAFYSFSRTLAMEAFYEK